MGNTSFIFKNTCHKHNHCYDNNIWLILRYIQVPHAFQQTLSAEKTPTLCCALPTFKAVITLWEGMKTKLPAYYFIIDAGIDKLEDYHEQTSLLPAYKLAMVTSHIDIFMMYWIILKSSCESIDEARVDLQKCPWRVRVSKNTLCWEGRKHLWDYMRCHANNTVYLVSQLQKYTSRTINTPAHPFGGPLVSDDDSDDDYDDDKSDEFIWATALLRLGPTPVQQKAEVSWLRFLLIYQSLLHSMVHALSIFGR